MSVCEAACVSTFPAAENDVSCQKSEKPVLILQPAEGSAPLPLPSPPPEKRDDFTPSPSPAQTPEQPAPTTLAERFFLAARQLQECLLPMCDTL